MADTLSKRLHIQKELSENLHNNFKEGNKKSEESYEKESELLRDFEIKIKAYESKEESIVDSHKKFTKLSKTLIGNIEAYKETFTDVRLIYNRNEKLRRYENC